MNPRSIWIPQFCPASHHSLSWMIEGCYPAWWTNKKLLKMIIEIVDFPIKNGRSFHSKMLVHQRVRPPLCLPFFAIPQNRQPGVMPFQSWPPEAFLLDLLPTRLAPCCRACSGKCSCTLWPWCGEVIILIPATSATSSRRKGKNPVFESSSFGKEWNMTFDFDKPMLTYLKEKVYLFHPKMLQIRPDKTWHIADWWWGMIWEWLSNLVVVVEPYPSEKYESVGIIFPNIWKVIKFMFQTTNQQLNVGQKSPCVLDSKLP